MPSYLVPVLPLPTLLPSRPAERYDSYAQLEAGDSAARRGAADIS
jgi:hypothetical protein